MAGEQPVEFHMVGVGLWGVKSVPVANTKGHSVLRRDLSKCEWIDWRNSLANRGQCGVQEVLIAVQNGVSSSKDFLDGHGLGTRSVKLNVVDFPSSDIFLLVLVSLLNFQFKNNSFQEQMTSISESFFICNTELLWKRPSTSA